MFKKMLWALPLAIAAGGPVAYFGLPDSWRNVPLTWVSSSETAAERAASSDPLQEETVAGTRPRSLPTPSHNLADVIRFDGVTTGWVLQRWPRVSTGLAELPLQGYRVPLVTGTKETDLAGSLTYYFNAQQKVQRISFHGTTGNARELLQLLTTRYKFTRRLTNDPGLFVYEVANPSGRPASRLKIQSAPVVKSSEPYRRFQVELKLERPS